MKTDDWNKIPKDEETDVMAEEGDLCTYIDGVAFLIQRKNNWNNVVCIRTAPSKTNIVKTFDTFRAWCASQGIQYFRVEGISHAYKMLYLVCRLGKKSGVDCDVIRSNRQSDKYGHEVYIVKTY